MKRLHDNVIYVEVKDENMSYYQLAEIFRKFGDIKIVRESKNHYYIDFLDIDQDALNGKTKIKKRNKDTIGQQMIELINSKKNNFPGIKSAEEYGKVCNIFYQY